VVEYSAVHGDFYLNGCWQASARQAEGAKSGSGGQVTHRVAAVHRLALWAGGCAPSMGAILEVQVLPRADHSERSEAQLREGDRAWEGSVERNREPMNKNRI
jgi:hypothetical protein